jgi:outer membrane protein insertion porin family
LPYYKAVYTGKWYFPVVKNSGFIIHPHTTLGYGNGYGKINMLPFFLNFYGGGIDTLPGYEASTLGPQNPNDATSAIGGNVEIFAGLDFIFPNGISDTLRTSLFVDFGNIFETQRIAGNSGNPGAPAIHYENIALENLRGSAGLMLSWISPFGLIGVGYGIPFNAKGSRIQQFGITFGTTL